MSRFGLRQEFFMYFLVSLFALACDVLILLSMAHYVHYTLATVLGFLVGVGVHYGLSVRVVFFRRKLATRKMAESFLYVVVGALGVLVSLLVVAICVEFFAMRLALAKIVAAFFSFVLGYVARKKLLF